GRGLDALLLLERGTKAAIPAVPADLPIYMVMNEARPQFHSGSGKVDFTSCSVVAPCFRNQALWEADVQDFAPLALEPSDEVVARKGGEVVWSYRSRGSSGDNSTQPRLPYEQLPRHSAPVPVEQNPGHRPPTGPGCESKGQQRSTR